MRWAAAVMLGLASYLLFLVFTIPAPLAIGWFQGEGSAKGLQIGGASGTLWSGHARQLVYQRMPLGELSWSFRPSRLLLGKLAYAIELKDSGQQLEATLVAGMGDVYRLEETDALLLASRLPELLRQRQLRLEGKVRAQDLDLAFSQGQLLAADGRLQWLDGALQSPMNLTIGDLQADLSTDESSGEIMGQIRDLKGAMGVDAEVRLKPDGNFRFAGKLKPSERADPGLAGALQAIGRQQPDGSIQLEYAGKL